MKKNGFTLAEVLITLAIIGVIATMTLPALMTNIAEQQARTGLKKGINTLTEAVQMHEAIEGINYGDLKETTVDDKDEVKSLYGLLAQRTSMDPAKSGDGKHETSATGGGSNYAVFFRDGSILMFDPATAVSTDENKLVQDDGLPKGYGVIYDTNGVKGPNVLSNCKGDVAGAIDADETQAENVELKDVCSTDKRVIKDQFGIKLRGAYAVPNGPAARWTYEK